MVKEKSTKVVMKISKVIGIYGLREKDTEYQFPDSLARQLIDQGIAALPPEKKSSKKSSDNGE